MSEKIVQFNEEVTKGQRKELVWGSAEETLAGTMSEIRNLTAASETLRCAVRG